MVAPAPPRPGERAVAIDVCRPPELVDSTWTYVDLELDLRSDGSAAVFVDDEDEFAERCAEHVISPDEATEATMATMATRLMQQLLCERREPFGHLAWERLAAAIDKGLPPLVELPAPSS